MTPTEAPPDRSDFRTLKGKFHAQPSGGAHSNLSELFFGFEPGRPPLFFCFAQPWTPVSVTVALLLHCTRHPAHLSIQQPFAELAGAAGSCVEAVSLRFSLHSLPPFRAEATYSCCTG
mmetsp:Transcript_35113/g.97039  ORF Transcript_35113/g.97039 Transcript_35113/m.97039 type:complete len:118 (-) Transcript_35113:427-780(-)